MADKQSEPMVDLVHGGEAVHTAASAFKLGGEAAKAGIEGGAGAAGKAVLEGVAKDAAWAVGVAFVAHTFGVTATAEDKLPPGHGEGPNHSTSTPASDPNDPSKVPNNDPQASHGSLMSHAPEVSSPNPLMSQDPQLSDDHQQSGDHQLSGGHQSSQDPQMSQAPEVSTHNPDVAPDPGYHH